MDIASPYASPNSTNGCRWLRAYTNCALSDVALEKQRHFLPPAIEPRELIAAVIVSLAVAFPCKPVPAPRLDRLTSPAPGLGGFSFTRAPMSRVPWHLFQDRQPRAHLGVAKVEQAI